MNFYNVTILLCYYLARHADSVIMVLFAELTSTIIFKVMRYNCIVYNGLWLWSTKTWLLLNCGFMMWMKVEKIWHFSYVSTDSVIMIMNHHVILYHTTICMNWYFILFTCYMAMCLSLILLSYFLILQSYMNRLWRITHMLQLLLLKCILFQKIKYLHQL